MIHRLLDPLGKLAELLERHKVNTWAEKIYRIHAELFKNENNSAIEDLKKLFHGAGSLDDLVILKSNGHLIDEADEKIVNQHLEHLIDEIKSFLD